MLPSTCLLQCTAPFSSMHTQITHTYMYDTRPQITLPQATLDRSRRVPLLWRDVCRSFDSQQAPSLTSLRIDRFPLHTRFWSMSTVTPQAEPCLSMLTVTAQACHPSGRALLTNRSVATAADHVTGTQRGVLLREPDACTHPPWSLKPRQICRGLTVTPRGFTVTPPRFD